MKSGSEAKNYIQSKTPILYDKSIPAQALHGYKDLLLDLARAQTTHGANVEKLRNHEVYSIRTNNKGRILFTYRIINGFNHIIILEILENHEYNRSKFLKKHVLAKFLEKNQAALETVIDADFEPAKLPPSTVPNAHDATLTFTAAYENNGTYIVLDEEQEKSRSAKTPLIIEGPPGSGKTSLAVVLLKQAVENNQRVLYVTQSSLLADKIRNEWVSSSEYIDGKADVLAYKELSADLIDDGKEIFEFWFTGFLRDKIKDKNVSARFSKEIDKVYEEFRIITGYNQKEYIDGIGQKQGLYQSLEDRKWLYTVFTLWKVYLESKNIKLSEFYDCRIENQEHYDLVIVDESQDLSHGQLKNLSKLTINTNIIYCIDPRQNLQDENPKLIYLKNILTNKETNQHPSVVQLSTHYRCPKAIMDFALVFNQLRIQLGPKNKTEAKIADSKIPGGEVEWLELSGNVGLLRLQGMRDDANVCVVTQKEFVQEVKDKLGITQVFMPEQVKGLEYKRVILYKILNTHTLQQVNKALGQGVANEDDMFSAALSACFVAATRATDSLYVIQNEDRLNNHVINKLKEKIVPRSNTQSTDNAPHVSTRDEWEARAKALVQNGNIDQAQEIINKHLDIADESKINKLLKQWNPNVDIVTAISSMDIQDTNHKENLSQNSKVFELGKKSHRKKKSRRNKGNSTANSLREFIKAIISGNLKVITRILQTNKDFVNLQDINGMSPLHIAIDKGNADVVNLLLDAKANIEQLDRNGNSPLLIAVQKGHLEIVTTLLRKGANANCHNKNHTTPLIFAVNQNCMPMVQVLLDAGADPSKSQINKVYPIHIAAKNGDILILKALLRAGSSFITGASVNCQNKEGVTPLFLAAQNGHIDAVTILLNVGADPNQREYNKLTALHQAATNGHLKIVNLLIGLVLDPNIQDVKDETPLMKALYDGHEDIVKVFLQDNRINLRLKRIDGKTALDFARDKNYPNLVELITKKITEENLNENEQSYDQKNQSDPINEFFKSAVNGDLTSFSKILKDNKHFLNIKDDEGFSALHLAIFRNRIEIVKSYLDAGGHHSPLDKEGFTPVLFAITLKKTEIIEMLLYAGADPNFRIVGKNPLIHNAAWYGCEKIVNLLLRFGANPNLKGECNTVALHHAAMQGHLGIVIALLGAKADPNVQDYAGYTPLHKAVINGHENIIRILLNNKNININLKDFDGRTALDIARKKNNSPILNLLLVAAGSRKRKHNENTSPIAERTATLLPMFDTLNLQDQKYSQISHSTETALSNKGLQYQKVPDDNHCLYHAVGIYLGKQVHELRTMVADYLQNNLEKYQNIIVAELKNRSISNVEGYIKGIRKEEWGGDLEISILMKIFNRPIYVYGRAGDVINGLNVIGDGEPINIYYNGDSHYDALLKIPSLEEIIEDKRALCAR
jgi:ankyrin repeat protein/thymidine kinase